MAVFVNEAAAREVLAKLSLDQLIAGMNKGVRILSDIPDERLWAEGYYSDGENLDHPNAEMRETPKGNRETARMFARLRMLTECAMIDSYNEILRRGASFDISAIRLRIFPNWEISPVGPHGVS